MPRITLMETLPANAPAGIDIRYTYDNGNPTDTWQVVVVGANTDTSVVNVNNPGGVNLVTRQNVATRRLIGHYPVPPIVREFVISSVQP